MSKSPFLDRLRLASCNICGICGKSVGRTSRSTDHVVPKAKGGYDGPGNKVLAHKSCNNRKADRWPTGCECIFLMAVNARLGVPDRPLAGIAA